MGSLIGWLVGRQLFGRTISAGGARAIAHVGLAAVLALIVAIAIWASGRNDRAQARVDRGQVGAAQASAGDAVNTIAGAGDREAASEDLTRANERDIRAAPGAEVKVSRQVDAAGRGALCSRDAYRNKPECKGVRR